MIRLPRRQGSRDFTAVTFPGCNSVAHELWALQGATLNQQHFLFPLKDGGRFPNRRGDHPANEVIAHDQSIFGAAGTPSRAFRAGGVGCLARFGDRTRALGIHVLSAIPAQYAECVHDAARGSQYAVSTDS